MPIPVIAQLIEQINYDPIKAIERGRLLYSSCRQRLWELAALCYAFALLATDDNEILEQFYSNGFFEGVKKLNPIHILLHSLQFVYGDREGLEGNRAQEHAGAMRLAFEARLSAQEVLELLVEQRGFAGLGRLLARSGQLEATMPTCLPPVERDDAGDIPLEDDWSNDDLPEPDGRDRGKTPQGNVKLPDNPLSQQSRRFTRAWCEKHIVLQADPRMIDTSCSLDETIIATVTFSINSVDDDGFINFRIRSFNIDSDID